MKTMERIKKSLKQTMKVVLMSVCLLAVGCVEFDDVSVDDEANVGSVCPEQVVVGWDRWRGFLSNVSSYDFVLNRQGMVDTVYYQGGYAVFTYKDEYRDVHNATIDMVELRLCGIDHMVQRMCTFNIGTNGYAKNATEIDMATGNSYTWNFDYDRSGYLTSIRVGDDWCTFKYVDGNLVEYTNNVDADETFYFSYSSISSHGYMPYFHAPGYIESDFGPILPMAYLAGLAGHPSANLPSLCKREREMEEYYWTYEYHYVFNNDGALVGLYYQQI